MGARSHLTHFPYLHHVLYLQYRPQIVCLSATSILHSRINSQRPFQTTSYHLSEDERAMLRCYDAAMRYPSHVMYLVPTFEIRVTVPHCQPDLPHAGASQGPHPQFLQIYCMNRRSPTCVAQCFTLRFFAYTVGSTSLPNTQGRSE